MGAGQIAIRVPRGMKIAVCVKQVPEAAVHKRFDPQTKRLDRSGEGALNAFDSHAVEEALRLRDEAGESGGVVVSLGPQKALGSVRKGLAVGAHPARLVSEHRPAGPRPRARTT